MVSLSDMARGNCKRLYVMTIWDEQAINGENLIKGHPSL